MNPLEHYGPNRGRPFVVTLEPADLITLRAKGRRNSVTARLEDVYRMILLARSNAVRLAKVREIFARQRAARERRRLQRGILAR